ncbi:MAG: hypothetical protein U5K81_03690 [Trueperaceae bacterium]|nr:hypothetical protein [Trueperaceae bacterium]
MERTWRWMPADQVRAVGPTADQRARGRLRDWWERFRGTTDHEIDVAPAQDRLGPLEARRLKALTPELDRFAQRAALSTLRGGRTRTVLLRPDDRGWDAVLDETRVGDPARLVPPDAPPLGEGLPRPAEAMVRDAPWLHVSRLERWWLRHHDGLGALRGLLGALAVRDGPWMLDVAPWAWAWMRRVLPEARALPAALAPAPLDGDALVAWFGEGSATAVRLREGGGAPDAATYHALARRARGAPGVALAIWQACLRDGAEAEAETDADRGDAASDAAVQGTGEEQDAPRGPTVWMRAPHRVELPSAASLARHDLLVLHAALVHGGASDAVLRRASGMGAAEVRAARSACEARGLLEQDEDGRVHVRAAALPSISDRLSDEGFARWAS